MPYRAQFSQSYDTTHDATQSAVLREEVSSLLLPAIELPSFDTLLCGAFLPATPSPSANAKIHALRAKPRKTSLLRDECTGTSVTHWTGDIRYKPHAELRAQFVVYGGALPLFLNTNLVLAVAVGMWKS
jgi:hypothetical protein